MPHPCSCPAPVQLAAEGRLGADGQLELGGHPVAVVYFRAGYTPDDYPSAAEWQARGLVERCSAFKCPTVAYQLAGAKKIQQVPACRVLGAAAVLQLGWKCPQFRCMHASLRCCFTPRLVLVPADCPHPPPQPQDLARPGVVEQYAASPEDAQLLRVFFAGQWGLEEPGEPATAAVIADAIAHPERYVLKPQREGGGNNYYGEALAQRLGEGRGLAAYILMQRIQPPVHRSLMVRLGAAVEADTLSELGVYSTYVRCGERVVVSREAGHLVRTKAATSDE